MSKKYKNIDTFDFKSDRGQVLNILLIINKGFPLFDLFKGRFFYYIE